MCACKISIIMGVLNAEPRLDSSIESILRQTYENWEFIICDDGSTDNTYEKLEEWARKDSRIIPIKNEKNMGLASALNHCLKYVTGEYVARMDDDDWSYPERFEKQIAFLETHKEFDFVSSAIDLYDGKKITGFQNVLAVEPKKEDFLWNSPFVHPATMFRRESIMKVNGYRIAKEIRRTEDIDLFMRMYAAGMKGYNIPEALLRYYVTTSAMKKRKYKYRIDEVIVRYKGFKMLGLLPKGWIYVIKPLVVGLLPKSIVVKMQKRKYK